MLILDDIEKFCKEAKISTVFITTPEFEYARTSAEQKNYQINKMRIKFLKKLIDLNVYKIRDYPEFCVNVNSIQL